MRSFRSVVVACSLSLALLTAASASLSPCRADEPAVQHLVLFKFKDDVEWAKLRTILDEFAELPSRIPGITGFQWGTNNSPEPFAAGLTHGFIVTFENAAARDTYVTHAAHVAFVDLVKPTLDDVFVLDFPVAKTPPAAEPGRTHHLVFFKFKDGTPEAKIDEVNTAFAALEGKISGLLRYQAGVNNSPEGLTRGYTHGYLLTFVNDRARDDYLPHPAHKEFGKVVSGAIETPIVLDFTVRPAAQHLFVTHGLEPFRVYQRGDDDTATIRFAGIARDEGPIEARLRSGRRTVANFDWKVVGKAVRGAFEAAIEGIPPGGEYTVEVRQRDALGNVLAHTEVADILVGDLWILAGQSNMQGVGNLVDLEEPDPRVHCFTMAHRWELAKEPLHWLSESPDPVHSGRYFRGAKNEADRRGVRAGQRSSRTKGAGLGLAFAKELVRRTGVPVGLIASAHGGTSMEQWNPARRDEGGASLYGSMFKQVRAAGGKVKGVLWYQGESDANSGAAPLFAERFKGLVAAYRQDLESPELPFYYVQIGAFVHGRESGPWDRIQDLQRLAETQIPHTAMISVIDLPLDDLIHVGTSGLKRAGKRLAKIAHKELFGAPDIERGPRLVSVKAAPGDLVLRVEYAEVNGGLLPREKVEGFSIRTKDGTAQPLIYKAFVDPAATNVVVLELRAPPSDGYLWYGAGLAPVCNLVDAEDMAAPVFGPVAIER